MAEEKSTTPRLPPRSIPMGPTVARPMPPAPTVASPAAGPVVQVALTDGELATATRVADVALVGGDLILRDDQGAVRGLFPTGCWMGALFFQEHEAPQSARRWDGE